MKLLITGSSGLIGSTLISRHSARDDEIIRLVRSPGRLPKGAALWDPEAGTIDSSAIDGVEAVVHLAGESVAGGRWTPERKARIRNSRVKGTSLLCETLAKLETRPRVLVAASANGYYGDRGDEILTEDSPCGAGFLAGLCKEWEAATQSAESAGIRVVNLRIGVVLSQHGGALRKMLTPFKMGAGGKVGSGSQYMSWIELTDLVDIIDFAIEQESMAGPVNAVSPNPVTNAEFTKALGRVIGRPTLFAMPAFAARLAFGEMADALLMASLRVHPKNLLDLGYSFKHPELESALRYLLGSGGSVTHH
ncbi:MAG TPA: TIGR01777 family oxidoreductase [Blastocatellia bacterium]|nr:TIGR01777 family oxidoreductase [Blastocatellia bacterium]